MRKKNASLLLHDSSPCRVVGELLKYRWATPGVPVCTPSPAGPPRRRPVETARLQLRYPLGRHVAHLRLLTGHEPFLPPVDAVLSPLLEDPVGQGLVLRVSGRDVAVAVLFGVEKEIDRE